MWHSSLEKTATFRIVPREHWLIDNRDYSRRAQYYNKENQTRLLTFDFTLS